MCIKCNKEGGTLYLLPLPQDVSRNKLPPGKQVLSIDLWCAIKVAAKKSVPEPILEFKSASPMLAIIALKPSWAQSIIVHTYQTVIHTLD